MHRYDVIVVGAGLSGLYMLKMLRDRGFSAVVLEAEDDVGGTWYRNRYPGLRCDVESMTYSYSFSDEIQKEWVWKDRYATQPDLLAYIHHVADRFDLRNGVRLGCRVAAMRFDEAAARWTVRTEAGEELTARFCVMATGCLSVPNLPRFPGLDRFEGEWYHTAAWPQAPVSFEGKRVGVVGTGSSGIQCIPVIAKQAAHLTVFQRTPGYCIPSWNAPLSEERIEAWKSTYPERRQLARTTLTGDVFNPPNVGAMDVSDEEREKEFERRWKQGAFSFLSAFNDLVVNETSNRFAQDFFRRKIRETVKDPKVADMLCPTIHFGTKRLCVDTDYYQTFNRDNVSLVDIKAAPIQEITAHGIRTADAEYALDVIVFATGYDAVTGALMRIDIAGRGGRVLKGEWTGGPQTYLGLAIAGYPNLFTVTGPQSPSVFSNIMVSLEQHVEWIADCLTYLRENGVETIEATPEAQLGWVEHANEVADRTLFPQANSWFVGANIPGKPRVCLPYVGGVGPYWDICMKVAEDGYRGFRLETAARADGGEQSLQRMTS